MSQEAPNPKTHEALEGFPVTLRMPVQWGQMDALSHVNNIVYLRWFEDGRIRYFETIGLFERPSEPSVGPILASTTCNFRQQLSYPDSVHVATRCQKIGRTSMTLEHRVVADSTGGIAADGVSIVVTFDYSAAQTRPVPEDLRASIEKLEGKSFGTETS